MAPAPAPAAAHTSSNWLRAVSYSLAGLVLGGLLVTLGVTVAVVDGNSMEPSLTAGDLVVLVRPGLDGLFARRDGYREGDVVALTSPQGAGQLLKRVVATGPGTVGIRAGVVTVGAETSQVGRFDGFAGFSDMRATTVPDGHLFVLGDNRKPLASSDSRQFGPVAAATVTGRMVASLSLP